MVGSTPNSGLQQMLQSAVQSIRWTYSVFWQLCPQQGILVWGDGYYNGAIKTRKTVQPMEVSTEEASLQRSQQLRELYDSLSAGESNQPSRRPCAALSPEDLTESEWFYLMCVSFSFPPGLGLPGKAFARRRHVWLTGANEADSKVFSRAILAKSARIQTVVCIPLMDGVLELGTTERVEKDMELIQHAKSFFTDHQGNCPKPAPSEHSTSNSVAPIDQQQFHSQPVSITLPMSMNPHGSSQDDQEDDEDDGDSDEDNDENDDNDDEDVGGSDSEAEIERISAQMMPPSMTTMEIAVPTTEPSELMQIEMSEGIRLGSPDDCSNNFDSELQMLIDSHTSSGQSDHQQPQEGSYQAWNLLPDEDLCSGLPQSSGATQIQELSQEDAHYSVTVSTVLNNNSNRWAGLSSITHLAHSNQSAFSKWSYGDHALPTTEGASQWLLKYILFTVPNLHCKDKDGSSPKSRDGEGGSRFRKGTPHEELSANHVLAERRRREKLNERFIILRSLVPFVTKMDKASILGDTIEYVKQLRKRIQDLESRNKLMESSSDHRSKALETNNKSSTRTNSGAPRAGQDIVPLSDKRKLRVLECSNGAGKGSPIKALEANSTNLQVSIIETDALLELQCPYREGLLLQIMKTLEELRIEVTSIQSSSANSIFIAEIRAKVKEIHGKKASIAQVKKGLHQIFSKY